MKTILLAIIAACLLFLVYTQLTEDGVDVEGTVTEYVEAAKEKARDALKEE